MHQQSNLLVLVLLSALLCAGCKTVTYARDSKVYKAEVSVNLANNLESSIYLLEYAKTLGTKNTKKCNKVAELALVLGLRSKWHAAMQLYLGGLSDSKPGLPPKVPSPSSVCGGTL